MPTTQQPETSATLCPVPIQSIEVSGAGAGDFLHSLLSNDIQAMSDATGQLNALCNIKGRVIADMLVWRYTNSSYRCLMDASLVATVCKRLQMYVLRRKVSIDYDQQEQWLGIIGQRPADHGIDGDVFSWPGIRERYLYRIDDLNGYSGAALATALQGVMTNDANPWDLQDVLSGQVRVKHSNSETFLPQHLNLDLANAVSFEKGCYPGQEVVSRLHFRGKSKQRCLRFSTGDNIEIATGQILFDLATANKKAGTVITRSRDENDKTQLLACVHTNYLDQSLCLLADDRVVELERQPLPYSVEN